MEKEFNTLTVKYADGINKGIYKRSEGYSWSIKASSITIEKDKNYNLNLSVSDPSLRHKHIVKKIYIPMSSILNFFEE